MKRTLGVKMVVRIWVSTTILFAAVMMTDYYYGKKEVVRGIEDESKNLAEYYTQKYEGKFGQAEKIADMLALHIALHPFKNEEELKQYMKATVLRNPEIYGTCIAFEPRAFDPGRVLFAPYYYSKRGEPIFVQLGNEKYNYFSWDWYKIPQQTGKSAWSEPYFDEGGGETIMITYSAPIVRSGQLLGVATVDVALDALAREVNSIHVVQTGYAFIVGKNGDFISFPRKSVIMKTKLGELAPALAGHLNATESGFVDQPDPLFKKRAWIVFYPIRSAGLSLAIVYPFREVMSRVDALQLTSAVLVLGGLLGLLVIVALVSRSIARPISDLATVVRKVAAGNLDVQLPPASSSDEVADLTRTFNKMVNDLRYHIEELKKSTAEKERFASELDIAYRIQQSGLPHNFRTFSGASGFEIFARSAPAREVGGDFYDFFPLGDEQIGFVIGDVSGKGVPAALFMAVSRTLLNAIARGGFSPGDCLSKVNFLLVPDNDMLMFVTVFYGVLNVLTGEVEYANAGHNPPYVLKRDGSVVELRSEPQIAVGVMDAAEYATRKLQLQPGDSFLLYTDGITEATNAQYEMYSTHRLESALGRLAGSSVEEMIIDLFRQVRDFAHGAEQSDDMTALALTFTGPTRREVVFRVANRFEEIEKLHDDIEAFGQTHGVSEGVIAAANLALEEILTNVVKYGYENNADHVIEVQVAVDRTDELRLRVEDDGRPFNPLDVATPDVVAPLEDRRIGGLGVYLTRELMDEVAYERRNGKNIFTMSKKGKPKPAFQEPTDRKG